MAKSKWDELLRHARQNMQGMPGYERHLEDHERAHPGPGGQVDHGPTDNWVRDADYESNPGFARMLDIYEGRKPRPLGPRPVKK